MLASTEKRVTARGVSPVKGSAGSFVTGAWLNTPDFLRAGDGSAVCTNEEKEVFLFLKEETKNFSSLRQAAGSMGHSARPS
jgi:hypothetical protein